MIVFGGPKIPENRAEETFEKSISEIPLTPLGKPLYHPFAERPTNPWDEWKQAVPLALETLV